MKVPPSAVPPGGRPLFGHPLGVAFCCFARNLQLFATIYHYLPLTLPNFATKIATKCHYTSISEFLFG